MTWIALLGDEASDVAPAPVEIGRSFIESQNAFDADAAIALFAPDAEIDHGLGTGVEGLSSNFAWHEAIGSHLVVEECTQAGVDQPGAVTCTYTYENAWTQVLGVGPFGGSYFDFVITNGQIQELVDNFDSTGFSGQAWEVFQDWVRANHPEDVSNMYDFRDPRNDGVRVTPEAVVLWKQYTDEFVESVADSGTP